jgi:membrane-associated phospholipid phosphatase
MSSKYLISIFLMLNLSAICYAQTPIDTSKLIVAPSIASNDYGIPSFFIPSLMVGYGILSVNSTNFKKVNEYTNIHIPHSVKGGSTGLDNILQFSPAIVLYGLNVAGIKGRNNVKDQTLVYMMSNVLLNASVQTIKKVSGVQRPDLSDYLSFPSGHTAEAFASAELLREEYQDVSPWIGYVGYGMAATTGFLRMYHRRHWLGDVVAGAGVGIISTRLSYLILPLLQKKLIKAKAKHAILMPSIGTKSVGFSFAYNF